MPEENNPNTVQQQQSVAPMPGEIDELSSLEDAPENVLHSPALPALRSLRIPVEKQVMTNWCWAAVTAIVYNYYHPNQTIRQGAIVAEILELNYCRQVPPLAPCNQRSSLTTALARLAAYRGRDEAPCSAQRLREEIAAGRPVACMLFNETTQGHYVIVSGYNFPAGTAEATMKLSVINPSTGSSSVIQYYQLLSGYLDSNWVKTYYTKASN